MEIVKYDCNYCDSDGDVFPTFYIKKKLQNGQTVYMALQLFDVTDSTYYWNIYLSIYNKRKHSLKNLEGVKSTGKMPFVSLAMCRTMFNSLLTELLKSYYIEDADNIVYCTWTDNKRRNVYYHFLRKYGFEYGNLFNYKVIYKKYPKNCTEF